MIGIANSKGHHAYTVEELKKSDKKFDIIFISHVIEHMHYRDLLSFMQFYIDRLKTGGKLILLSPLLVENFYYDFTHERPYYPQAIWQMFGDYSNSLSLQKKILIQLDDIFFIKDSFRTRTWRSYYTKKNYLAFMLTRIYNYLLAALWLVSGARIGKRLSWIGVYKKL
jgi:SAM-dependent methyltransferase